ncbi:MarR family winged helix-turn-helix transcriptional regulator [Promicromonospora sp. Populi]|uniref:MarR family winged helix-turn-helix transcriptional regulator n=1 Tax=Promicromonospora sp. Populi TaxID=3239420 RepID=UPI0034E269EA
MTEGRLPSAREAAEAWESLFRAQVAVMRRLLADDIWGDLSMREYDVLFTLSVAPTETLRLRELNENILMAQSSLSRMVERLEKRGLVKRHPSPDDGRGVLVSLTEEGATTQKELGRRHVRSIAHYVTPAMDADELLELRRLTENLRAAQLDIDDF